jgi:hypothetical protein
MVPLKLSGILGILYIPPYLIIIITYFFVSVKRSYVWEISAIKKEGKPGIPESPLVVYTQCLSIAADRAAMQGGER